MSGLAEERLEHLAEHLHLPDLPVLLPEVAEAAVAGEHSYARFTEDLLAACAAAAITLVPSPLMARASARSLPTVAAAWKT